MTGKTGIVATAAVVIGFASVLGTGVMVFDAVFSLAMVSLTVASVVFTLFRLGILDKPEEELLSFSRRLLPRRRSKLVMLPPGNRAVRVLSWIFSRKAMAEIFNQSVADMRKEAWEDYDQGRHWRRRWMIICWHIAIIFTVVAYLTARFGKTVAQVWKIVG